jgi:hypothetical protein
MELGNAGTKLQAYSSSKLSITYSTITPTFCQILNLGGGNFSVQYVIQTSQPNVVTCSVTASQSGDAKYFPADPVTRTFTYSKALSKIGVRQPTLVTTSGVFIYGTVSKVVGQGGSTTPIEITTASPDICSLAELYYTYSSDGTRATIRAIKNGTCVIKFSFPGDSHLLPTTSTWFTPISGIKEVPVGSNTAQTISFGPIVDREYGPGLYLKATASSGLPISYKSITPTICYILYPTEGPAVQAVYPRSGLDSATCTVEASQPGDNRYAPALPVQRSFNWIKANMKISVSRSTSFIGKGPHVVDAAIAFSDSAKMSGMASLGHPLIVSTTTPTICSVAGTVPSDQRGGIFSRSTITALSNGTCKLSFTFLGTDDRRSVTLQWSANVTRL